MSQEIAFEVLRRSLDDGALVQALQTDPAKTLTEAGITDQSISDDVVKIFALMFSGAASQQETNRRLEEQIIQAQNDTLNVAKQMKLGLRATLDQIDRAYRSTMLMYQITFYLGVLLIIVAVMVALLGREPLLPAVFGTLGIMDLLAFFLFKPQERLQASRSSLAQVQAALYNWFMDSVNLNTLMARHDQSRDFDGAAKISESLLLHTEKTLEMLQKYCKLTDA